MYSTKCSVGVDLLDLEWKATEMNQRIKAEMLTQLLFNIIDYKLIIHHKLVINNYNY